MLCSDAAARSVLLKLPSAPTPPCRFAGGGERAARVAPSIPMLPYAQPARLSDFTSVPRSAIGDPSGRNAMRPQLTPAQIQAAAATYAQQVAKILRPDAIEVVY